MSQSKEATPAVMAVGQIGFEGHIIPHTWYEHITYKTSSGKEKVDLQAIVILSDIVYWYRPRRVYDEQTGDLVRSERRFSADKLQRSYAQIADRFGISKPQATRACKRLRDMGVITMEFRTIQGPSGPLNNVLFLEPVPEKLIQINHATPSTQICKEAPTKLSGPIDKNVETNTKNTTEIISENTTEKEPISEKSKPDILDAMVHYATREQPEDWSTPANDWNDAVDAFAGLVSVDPSTLPKSTRREWSRVLQRIGTRWKVGPTTVAHVIEKVPESQFHWKTYGKPHAAEDDIGVLIGQLQNGGIQAPARKNGGENRHDRNRRIIDQAREKIRIAQQETIEAEYMTIL